jgi:hypothetical protein
MLGSPLDGAKGTIGDIVYSLGLGGADGDADAP